MEKNPESNTYSVNTPNGPEPDPKNAASAEAAIPDRFRGTAADQYDMQVLGKRQVLRRSFKFITMLGFASTVTVMWEWIPIISIYALQDGGLPIVFWGLVVGCAGMSLVYASLAEVASM